MLILNTTFEGFSTRVDKTLKLVFGTQEVTPEQVMQLTVALQKFVYLALSVEEFRSEEKEILKNIKTDFDDTSKSQAQRIRAVLFLLWKQGNGGYEDYELFYRHHTEKYIQHLKSKIEP